MTRRCLPVLGALAGPAGQPCGIPHHLSADAGGRCAAVHAIRGQPVARRGRRGRAVQALRGVRPDESLLRFRPPLADHVRVRQMTSLAEWLRPAAESCWLPPVAIRQPINHQPSNRAALCGWWLRLMIGALSRCCHARGGCVCGESPSRLRSCRRLLKSGGDMWVYEWSRGCAVGQPSVACSSTGDGVCGWGDCASCPPACRACVRM